MRPLILLAVLALPAFAAPIKVMILDGESGGTYHKWQATTPVLKKELEETGLFQVDVVTVMPNTPPKLPVLGDYQAIVMNYDAAEWPGPVKSAFEDYIRNGGGLVVVHASDNAFPNWVAFNEMAGIGGWRNRTPASGPYWYYKDGKLVSDASNGPTGAHGERLPFQLVTREPEHPIMRGLPRLWMHQGDELYNSMRGPGKNMTVLATAYSDPNNHGTGRDEPMLMVLSFGKGRIFHTTMGHDVAALVCVGFMTTFQRGTEWAATGTVTQKVPATFPTENTVSFRSDLH